MKVRVQVIIESDKGEQECLEEVVSVQREGLRSEDLGLTLAAHHAPAKATTPQSSARCLAPCGLAITEQLDRLKWALWHGNVYKALRKIESLEMDLEAMEESPEHSDHDPVHRVPACVSC